MSDLFSMSVSRNLIQTVQSRVMNFSWLAMVAERNELVLAEGLGFINYNQFVGNLCM